MQITWQEILTFIIIGIALFFLARRYFFPKKKVRGSGAEECGPCNISSCEGCTLMDLKKDIEAKRADSNNLENSTKQGNPSPGEQEDYRWKKSLEKEISLRRKHLK